MLKQILDFNSEELPKTKSTELETLSEVIRKENLKRLENSNKECKNLYLDSISELSLDTYLKHYRYLLYVYFRFRIDLLNYFDPNKQRNIKEEWQQLIGIKHKDPQTGRMILVDDSLFKETKLVYGNGANKEVIEVLPGICPEMRERNVKNIRSSYLTNVVMSAKKAEEIMPSYANIEIAEAFGVGFKRLADIVAPDDLKFEHARIWIQKIENIDKWFINKFPKLENKLVPLPDINKVREIMGINEKGEKINKPNTNVNNTTEITTRTSRGKFTRERKFL